MRDVVLREDYPDGASRETLACGHVLYLTKGKPTAERRCLLCIRRRPQRRRNGK